MKLSREWHDAQTIVFYTPMRRILLKLSGFNLVIGTGDIAAESLEKKDKVRKEEKINNEYSKH